MIREGESSGDTAIFAAELGDLLLAEFGFGPLVREAYDLASTAALRRVLESTPRPSERPNSRRRMPTIGRRSESIAPGSRSRNRSCWKR